MDFTQPLDDDLEPTPLPMSYPMPVATMPPHQAEPDHQVHRVSMIGPADHVLENLQQLASLSSTPVDRSSTTSPGNLVSDSDTGAVNDEEDDDDFHSAASHDEFHLIPEPTDVIFGRGQPLRDHPGNMRFRGIIKRFTATYRNANKADKTKIIQQIVKAASANGTRFLVPHNNQDPFEGCRPAKPAEIRGKISHGLRDAIKVEDLLDNEFVQLWADDQGNAQPGARPGRITSAPPRQQNMMGAPPRLPVAPRRSGNFPGLSGGFSRSTGPAIYHVSVRNPGSPDPTGKIALGTQSEEESAYLDFVEKGGAPAPRPFGGPTSGDKSPDDEENLPTARVVSARASLVDFRPLHGYERKILIAAAAVIAALIVAVSVSFATRNKSKGVMPTASPTVMPTSVSSTLDSIHAKGYITCGVTEQKGYSVYDAEIGGTGFEIELCRAMGAAIFGREMFGDRLNEPVEYVFLEVADRFVALDNEEIDVLMGVTTHTMERQVFEPTTGRGFSFSIPYLYSGLKFSGIPKYVQCADAEDSTSDECKDLQVCVISGSTHVGVVSSILPESAIVETPTFTTMYSMFTSGDCNVMTGEEIDINSPSGFDGNFTVGEMFHSREPIAIVTRDDDLKFSDFCNWLLQSLITAEELTYSSSTASLSDIPIVDYWGSDLSYMFLDAIAVVGDYGTIFDAHLGNYIERSTINHLNLGQSAAHYPIPFGNVVPEVPPSFSGGTIEKIHTRGHLKCGITPGAIFAKLDTSTGKWTGLDVAFCEAVSAAIFDGAVNVVYTALSSKDRFVALAEGKVDILARVTTITLERDILEPSSGVGFSFSPPNFHDEFRMGGIPPYTTCADNLDTESEECQSLLVCVNDGTTQSSALSKVLPSDNILACEDTEEEVAKFIAGECNVIAGGYIDLTPSNMEYLGYTGDWEVGHRSFSREPLALVTREDDIVFSNFVYWVVTSIFYADTQNITQATAHLMPEVDLFQPQVGDEVFRNAVGAVGSYSEIWERTATANGVAPFGRNRLNTEPYGPQIMSRMLWDKPSSQ
eukprot:Nitzschia sp. Nitz4//scaffold52_size167869//146596//149872//NITZ4_002295-RA/size167869-snap-gene-0.216-mRNA-1//1//CDS//3329554092//1019//frame0